MQEQETERIFTEIAGTIFQYAEHIPGDGSDTIEADCSWVIIKIAQFSENDRFHHPTCVLFSLYNLLVRLDYTTALLAIKKSLQDLPQQSNIQETAKICSILIQSAILAQSNRHKQSLNLLQQLLENSSSKKNNLFQSDNIKEKLPSSKQYCIFKKFYEIVSAKIVSMHNINVFRRDFYQIIMKCFEKFGKNLGYFGLSKALQGRKSQIESRICVVEGKQKMLGTSGNMNSMSTSRFTLKTKNGSKFQRESSQNSLSTNKKGSVSPNFRFKKDFKKPPQKFVNPYLANKTEKLDFCAFM